MKTLLIFVLSILIFLSTSLVASEPNNKNFQVTLELAEQGRTNYHEPYVAVWLETPGREAIATLAAWYRVNRGDKWLKDLRHWWRKAGSSNMAGVDSVTGATRKAGTYKIDWDGRDNMGTEVPGGNYVLHVEAVREKGGREHLRIPVTLPLEQKTSLFVRGTSELGMVSVK